MSALQTYLQQHTLNQFNNEFGSFVKLKKHPQYKNLLLFKYKQSSGNQFKSEVVKEARGIILDEKDNYKPVCYAYKKFFNYNEKFADEIDWPSALVQEKTDGSLCCLYFYGNSWCVATTGQADAGQYSNSTSSSDNFYNLFWKIWQKLKYKMPSPDDHHFCFIFELMSKENRIVVRMEDAGHNEIIWLHGVRDMNTLQEVDPVPFGTKYKWAVVKNYPVPDSFPHWDLDLVKIAAANLPPTVSEGFVIRDKYWNRIKVKSPAYVSLGLLNVKNPANINLKHLLQICKSSEASEFLAYYPQWTNLYKQVENCFNQFAESVDNIYSSKLAQLPADCLDEQVKDVLKTVSSSTGLRECLFEFYLENRGKHEKMKCLPFLRSHRVTLNNLFNWLELSNQVSRYIDGPVPVSINRPSGTAVAAVTQKKKKGQQPPPVDKLDRLLAEFEEIDIKHSGEIAKPPPPAPTKSKKSSATKKKNKKVKGKR